MPGPSTMGNSFPTHIQQQMIFASSQMEQVQATSYVSNNVSMLDQNIPNWDGQFLHTEYQSTMYSTHPIQPNLIPQSFQDPNLPMMNAPNLPQTQPISTMYQATKNFGVETMTTVATYPFAALPEMKSPEVQIRTNEIFDELYKEFKCDLLVLTQQFQNSFKHSLNLTIYDKEITTIDSTFTIERIDFPDDIFQKEQIIVPQAQEMNTMVVMECFRLFLGTYFSTLIKKCFDLEPVERLNLYEKAWTSFINASMNIGDKYKGMLTSNGKEDRLLPKQYATEQASEEPMNPILTKALKAWEYSFFKHKEYNKLIPSAVMNCIIEEESGRPDNTSKIPDAVVISYQILGMIKRNGIIPTDIEQKPSPMSYFEFIQYHLYQRNILSKWSRKALEGRKDDKVIEVEEEPRNFGPAKKKARIVEESLEEQLNFGQKENATIFTGTSYQANQENIPYSTVIIASDHDEQECNWIKHISKNAMEKITQLIPQDKLKEKVEGKYHDKSGKEVKYVFTAQDFQELAQSISQEIDEKYHDKTSEALTSKRLYEIIRRLKNNISSREYRKRKKLEDAAVSTTQQDSSTTNIASENFILSDAPLHSYSGSGYEEIQNFDSRSSQKKKFRKKIHKKNGSEEDGDQIHTLPNEQENLANWENLLTTKQLGNLRQVQQAHPDIYPKLIKEFNRTDMIINLAENIKPDEAKQLHDPKVFRKLVRRIKNNIYTRESHKKEKEKTEEKRSNLAQLEEKNKRLHEETMALGEKIEEMRKNLTNFNISSSEISSMDFEMVHPPYIPSKQSDNETDFENNFEILDYPTTSSPMLDGYEMPASVTFWSPGNETIIKVNPPTQDWRTQRCKKWNFKYFNGKINVQSFVIEIQWNQQPYHIQPIRGDGNCLFRSLAFCLTGFEEEHGRMRQLICGYMKQNRSVPQIIEMVKLGLLDETLSKISDEYVVETYFGQKKMDQDGTWGSQVEIFIFTKIFGCIVYVFSPVTKSWNKHSVKRIDNSTELPTFFLQNTNGNHFDVCLM
uniref:OTU domain-containing protein n=1 Tax=Acrobeloides nanus TaxID=290746 RepID=A0A914DS21_9BILA